MKTLSSGTVHKIPLDLKKAISSSSKTTEKWEDLTPLARNEFICQVISSKLPETRKKRISRICEDLMNGKRRPCCWAGCIHRTDKPLSSSQKFILNKKSRNKI